MMKARAAVMVLAAVSLLVLSGCGNGGTGAGTEDDGPDAVSDADATQPSPQPRGEIVVIAVDPDGDQLRDAQVHPSSLDPNGHAFGEVGRMTGGDGTHSLNVPPGNYRVGVSCDGVESEPQDVKVAVDKSYDLEFTLDVELPDGKSCVGRWLAVVRTVNRGVQATAVPGSRGRSPTPRSPVTPPRSP